MSNNGAMSNVNLTFYDNFVPSLKAAQYTISVSQALTVDTKQTQQDGGNTNITNPPQAAVSQTFIVRAPRFTLSSTDVHRVFPPTNGVGNYDHYLPMIVLNKRALPWERKFEASVSNKDSYPWMALLVFTEDELLPPDTAASTASPLNPTRTASLPLNNTVKASYNHDKHTDGPPTDILGPSLTLEDDEDPKTIFCNVIDIAVETFVALMPGIDDLPFLAHVRQVSTEHKEPLKTKHDGWFAAVIANRFAIAPVAPGVLQQRNIAHLVSLEGLEPYLTKPPTGVQKVRLISLYSWAFSCQQEPQENFKQLMLDLISPGNEQGTNLLLRLPPPTATSTPDPKSQQQVMARLQDGFVPLSYATRSGEQTFAWYRGPLAPVITTPFLQTTSLGDTNNPAIPQNTSEAMVYDASTGLFDQSYVVAFQTGRSLALASLPFATSVQQWRRAAHRLVDVLLELMRSPHLTGLLQSDDILDAYGNLATVDISGLAKHLNAGIIAEAFKDFLATTFANTLAKQIGRVGELTQQGKNQQLPNQPTLAAQLPMDLSRVMQHPTVVALLHQLSGLPVSGGGDQQFEQDIMPDLIVKWLAQLALLYGVPFNNLVPNVHMLPQDAIRFFYIDQNWLDCLLDGALSVGMQSSRDSLFHQLTRDSLYRTVGASLHQVRDRLRNVASPAMLAPRGIMAGFVLRSAGVVNWPGLEVRAWSAADPTHPMKPLRLDRVSPSVMIGIYPDIPSKLEFNEPSEGLVFGYEDQGIALRYLPHTQGATPSNIGQPIQTAGQTYWLTPDEIPKRAHSTQQPALQIAGPEGLVGALQKKFPNSQPTLSPASFAVQMVRVPEQMLFQTKTGGTL